MTPPAPILVARPWLGPAEIDAAARALRSGWITQGPEVLAFEREFAAFVRAPHACAVSSATAALHLALLAVGVQPGDEVVTVSHSFIATANAVRYCGALPVFVDVRPDDFNIDPKLVEGALTGRTRAILCVHQLGMPCDLDALTALGRRHALPVIEDAACAIGSEILAHGRWERIGAPHGDVACFSFHPRKLLTTGDGGMLTTRHAPLDRKFRLLRQHGMSVPDAARHAAREVVVESYRTLGFNYRLTDIQAAVGRAQLARLPDMVARRRALAARYRERLALIDGLTPPEESPGVRSNWQSYCVRLPEDADQRRVMADLRAAGIATRPGVMCAHREPAYAAEPWRRGSELGESERARDHTLILPLYHEMTEGEQDRVVEALAAACARSAAGGAR